MRSREEMFDADNSCQRQGYVAWRDKVHCDATEFTNMQSKCQLV
jgi:hypothetical protein